MKIKDTFHRITTHSLARDSIIVFAGSMVSNVGSYIYHLLMGRMLGPSGYGELSSLLSILYIFTVPLLVGQTVLVKFVSKIKAQGEPGQAKTLLFSVSGKALLLCLIGLPLSYVFSPWISSFLHLSTNILFILVYIFFAISLLTVITTSILQGYQKFLWFSILTSGVVIFKVFLTIPAVHYGIVGVMGAAILSAFIVYVLYVFPLKFIISVKEKPVSLSRRETFLFTVPTLLTLLGITSIYSTDIILVRHFFTPKEAGLYAALAILGKIIYFASSSVALVLFPVLSERSAKGVSSHKLIRTAIMAVAVISAGLSLTYFIFPDFIIHMLFGTSYQGAGSLLGLFGIFIALFSIAFVVINACLGIGLTGIWFVPAICAVIQILLISIVHPSLRSVININIAVSTLLVIGSVGYYVAKTYEKIQSDHPGI